MRHFLVVAPLLVDAEDLPLDEDAQPTTRQPVNAGRMDSRERFDPGELTHTYVRHADRPAGYPDTFTHENVQLNDIRLVVAAEAVLLHANAHVDGELTAAAVPDVEQLLSDAVRGYVRRHIGGKADITWVNRTLLAPSAEVPEGWLAAEDTVRAVLRPNGDAAVLTVGWGNNALDSAAAIDPIRTRLLEGLTDAQVLWQQLDRIAKRAATLIKAYRDPPGGRRRRHTLTGAEVDEIAKDLATHNLYYDALLLNVQGTRKQVAIATLRSWRYDTLLDRVTRRVNEIERVARQESDNHRQRYQGIVEAVLLAIGLVSLLQLLLALVQTAYSGGVDRVPGGQDRLSIMEFLRRIDLDLAIWLTSAATVLAFIGIVMLKRRG